MNDQNMKGLGWQVVASWALVRFTIPWTRVNTIGQELEGIQESVLDLNAPEENSH